MSRYYRGGSCLVLADKEGRANRSRSRSRSDWATLCVIRQRPFSSRFFFPPHQHRTTEEKLGTSTEEGKFRKAAPGIDSRTTGKGWAFFSLLFISFSGLNCVGVWGLARARWIDCELCNSFFHAWLLSLIIGDLYRTMTKVFASWPFYTICSHSHHHLS